MVEQILEFAGIESGQRAFALRPVALAPILRDIIESSQGLIRAAGIDVEYAIDERILPVLGDEVALRRAFENLIANAIKYGEAGRWIGVRASQTGREVQVTIADRGIGIASAEQSRIFEPFYRVDHDRNRETGGTGLGLAIAHRAVQIHGGRIVARNANPGLEVEIQLPHSGVSKNGEDYKRRLQDESANSLVQFRRYVL